MDRNLSLKTALFTPGPHGWGNNSIWIGDPGVAKSAIATQMCHALDIKPYVLMGSQIEAPDIGGFPAEGLFKGKRCLDPLTPQWALEANDICENTGSGAALILDELTNCQPLVQAALLRVVNERVVGNVPLHPRVRILAFANPYELASELGGSPLGAAFANRFGHHVWVPPTVPEFVEHMMQTAAGVTQVCTVSAIELEAQVMDKWSDYFSQAAGELTAFLLANSSRAHMVPKDAVGRRGAWPSYRTWELAIRSFAGAKLHGMSRTDRIDYVAGYVSGAIAAELNAYLLDRDIPSAEDWMQGEVVLDIDKTRPDVVAAVLRTACSILDASAQKARSAHVDDSGPRGRFVEQLLFLMRFFCDNGHAHSLLSAPIKQTFHAWNSVSMVDTALFAELVRRDRPTALAFRNLPMLRRLEGLGVLEQGTT